jgi:hypothetical protein
LSEESANTRLMADMCTIFEQIAKNVIEKEEKEQAIRGSNQESPRKYASTTSPPKHHRHTSSRHGQNLDSSVQHPSPSDLSGDFYIPDVEVPPPMHSSRYTTSITAPIPGSFAGLAMPGDTVPQETMYHEMQDLSQLQTSPNFSQPPSDTYPLATDLRLWHIPITAEWDFPDQFLGNHLLQSHYKDYEQPIFASVAGEREQGLARGHDLNMLQRSLWNQGFWNMTG